MSKTLGELFAEIDRNDQLFKSYCSGFDLAATLAGDTTSEYSSAQLAWLWGHYTGQIPENVDSLDHDHILQCTGIDQGFPMWDLLCVHEDDDPRFFTWESEGESGTSEVCLVQEWWDEANTDIIHSTDLRYDNDPPGLAVITTYLEGGEPLLRSYANAKDWKEGLEY